MSLLVTGFGPFADANDNASGRLAESCGQPHVVLDVSYQAVNEFFGELSMKPPDVLLLMGVDVRASKMKLETVAHNTIGPKPDVRGEVWGPGPIDLLASHQLAATLWTPELLLETDVREPGTDAGGYLCNFSFYRAAQTCPKSRVGFIHVPPFTTIPMDRQLDELASILNATAEAREFVWT